MTGGDIRDTEGEYPKAFQIGVGGARQTGVKTDYLVQEGISGAESPAFSTVAYELLRTTRVLQNLSMSL